MLVRCTSFQAFENWLYEHPLFQAVNSYMHWQSHVGNKNINQPPLQFLSHIFVLPLTDKSVQKDGKLI